MGKRSKRHNHQFFQDLINDNGIFEKMEEGGGLPAIYSTIHHPALYNANVLPNMALVLQEQWQGAQAGLATIRIED